MKKKVLIAAVISVVLILAEFNIIKTRGGFIIRPTKDTTVNTSSFFSQHDEKWKNDKLGNSSYSIDRSGCLLTCISSIIQLQNIDTGLGEINPKTVNELLTANEVYDANGNLLWDKLENVLDKSIVREQAGKDTSANIEQLLDHGIYPVVRVKMPITLRSHYVLIIGSENGQFMCMDPLSTDNNPVSLKKYSNKVYAVRYVK